MGVYVFFGVVWSVCGEEDGRDWICRAIQIEVRVRKTWGGGDRGHISQSALQILSSQWTLSQITTKSNVCVVILVRQWWHVCVAV